MRSLTLFAGCGGADIGLRDAGWEHVLGVEWDDTAASTARAAGFPVVTGDVRGLSLYDGIGPIDAMWASPPCQDWSTAGKREGAGGDRNGWPWTFDVVDHVRPRWLLAENVTGMLNHTGACKPNCTQECPAHYWHEVVLAEARKRFAWVGWRVLDAADFGVPQRRHRVFLVCGPRPIEWPEATHQDPKTLAQADMFAPKREAWVSCGEALGLTVATTGAHGKGRPVESVSGPSPTVTSQLAKQPKPWKSAGLPFVAGSDGLRTTTIGSGLKGSEWTVERPSPTLRNGNGAAGLFIRTEQTGAVAVAVAEPAPTVATAGNQYLHGGDPGVRLGGSQPERLDSPSMPVLARASKGHSGGVARGRNPASASDGLWLATGRRRLTVDECRILMGFPEGYPLQGTKTSQYKQLGNACCPIVVQALGIAVSEAE